MGFFGPNINKMKEQHDIEGLLMELGNSNRKIRIDAIEALKEIGDSRSIEKISKDLINVLKYGESEDKEEAITIIQGRAPSCIHFLIPGESKRVEALQRVSIKMSLETFRNALLEQVHQSQSGSTKWYALIALVELGDRTDEVLLELIRFSDAWIKALEIKGSESTDGMGPLFAVVLGTEAQEETLRALSCFKGSSEATESIIMAYEGKFLSTSDMSVDKEKAIYALAALGNPSSLERLEYLVSKGSAPKSLLDYFGRATYDQIKNMVESGIVPSIEPVITPNEPTDIRCPLCGSQTTIRTAKQGPNVGSKFHVCHNYPECKGKIASALHNED